MELNIKGMNKTWRNAGLVAIGVGLLAYPAYRLYKYLASRNADKEEEIAHYKLFPSYRGKHKPHHRKATGNGHIDNRNGQSES
jgi:uncharacterized membrane protein YebE (DUF533 family)